MTPSQPADSPFSFNVFSKPWRMPLPELGAFMQRLGVDGVELPVRPGFQIEPGDAGRLRQQMCEAARILADFDIRISSVASEPAPAMIEACAELHVPIIRVLAPIPHHQNFWEAVDDMQRAWDQALPELDRHHVTLGVQNHCDRYLTHAMHLWHVLRRYDPRHVAAVWDPAHNALQGEDADLALDILKDRICMVSLKNARRRRLPATRHGDGGWETYWTRGSEGLADWRQVASELRRRGWSGPLCLHAEYTQEHRVDELIADDLTFARLVFADHDAVAAGARANIHASARRAAVVIRDRLTGSVRTPTA